MNRKTKTIFQPQPALFLEAFEGLIKILGPLRALQFWLSFERGEGDYLKIRKQLFGKQSIKKLVPQIKKFNR